MPDSLFPISLVEQIACVEREIKMRQFVYPRRIAENRLTQKTADREIAHMTAVLATLQSIKEKP